MKLQFDHVIHYVDDAHEIMSWLNNNEKLHAVYGGRHEKRGTYNTLLHFGLSYIEYLSMDEPDVFEEYGAVNITYSPFSTIGNDRFKEGFYRVALRTHNLEALADSLKEKGILVNGPINLSRKQPNGKLLEWKLLFAGNPNSSLPLPFFIDWLQTDEERYKNLKEEGFIPQEESEDISISYVGMAVNDLARTVANWSDWFGLKSGVIEEDKELNAKVQRLYLPEGDLLFAEPLGKGIVSNVLSNRGERTFMLKLKDERNIRRDKEIIIKDGIYRFSTR